MKKMVLVCAVSCCIFLSRISAADTLKLVSATGSVSSDGAVAYPYNFSVNGVSALTALMCIDYNREVTIGETWSVSKTALPTDNSAASVQLRADAWLYSQLGTYSNSDVQYAVWDILDPTDVGVKAGFDATAQMLSTEGMQMAQSPNLIASGFFSKYSLYSPTADTSGWTEGVPQRYIGTAVTPEPSSVVLLASGMLMLGGWVRFGGLRLAETRIR